jgi:hypothetical protein
MKFALVAPSVSRAFCFAVFFFFCFSCFSALVFAAPQEELDVLAAKTQDRLNAYYNTTAIVFVKGYSGPYNQDVYFVADYWTKKGVWVASFQVNVQYSAAVWSKSKLANGFIVDYSDFTDWLHVGFYCPRSTSSQVTYFVYAKAASQFASIDGVANALTLACLDFQAALATQATRAPQASSVPSAVPSLAPSALPSVAPSVAPTAPPAPSLAPSVAASAAPSAAQRQPADYSLVWLALAVIVVAALAYWVFFRGKNEVGEGSVKKTRK